MWVIKVILQTIFHLSFTGLDNLPKKRVTYRSSPIYLMREADKHFQEQTLPNRKYANGISKSNKSDPFDPISNPIVARYLVSTTCSF